MGYHSSLTGPRTSPPPPPPAPLPSLLHQFDATRLPEAVFGACVSPLTGNAPCYGDSFHWHVDADPSQVPPSPWADTYGKYTNRSPGKPRFVSVLVYLNPHWPHNFGAPTRFLDPPTGEVLEIYPVSWEVAIGGAANHLRPTRRRPAA